MKSLQVTNKISIFILYLAAIVFVGGGTLAVTPSSQYVPYAILLSLVVAITSIPFTLVSLIKAHRLGVISFSYILFSVLISCFIAGLGWFVIPFALNRDIKQCISEQLAVEAI
jgi:hypothetical protein